MTDRLEIIHLNENESLWGTDKFTHLGNGLVKVTADGDQTLSMVRLIEENYERFLKNYGNEIHLMVDINNTGKNPPEARRLWTTMAKKPLIKKVAVFGLHPVAQVMASFIMGTISGKKYKFFKTEEQALKWLKEDEQV